MSYSLTNTTTQTITPKKAMELLKHNTFPGQRPLKDSWVKHLAEEQRTGQFIKGELAFASNCKSDAKTLVNGQHSLTSIITSGLPQKFTVDEYKYETDDDLWHLFGKFDIHRPRTESHIMKAARGLFRDKDLREVPLLTLSQCGSALVWLGSGIKPSFKTVPTNKTQKAELVQKYSDEVFWVDSVVSEAELKNCPLVSIVCAMISTHRASKSKADSFWRSVLSGVDLKRGSAEHSLNKEIGRGLHKRTGLGGGNRYRYQYAICISWWNSYISGARRKIVQFSQMTGVPDVLA